MNDDDGPLFDEIAVVVFGKLMFDLSLMLMMFGYLFLDSYSFTKTLKFLSFALTVLEYLVNCSGFFYS